MNYLKKLFSQIKGKLLLGFVVLVSLFLLSSVITGIILYRNQAIITKFSQIIDPSIKSLKDFNFLIYESKMLSNNVLNSPSDVDSRLKLLENVEKKYPILKKELTTLAADWDNEKDKKYLDTVLAYTDELMISEKQFAAMLDSPEKYTDEMNLFQAKELFDNLIIEETHMALESFEKLSVNKTKEKEKYIAGMVSNSQNIYRMLFFVAILVIAAGIFLSMYMTKLILDPLNEMKDEINDLGRGSLKPIHLLHRNDEIGEMATSLSKLVDGLTSTAKFASEVGKGNHHAEFTPLSEEDILGYSIIEMRDNLKTAAEKDSQRNWASTGLAKFAEIFRDNTTDIVTMADQVLLNLVKYTESNQGAIYILNDESPRMIEMKACYAYNRKKYLNLKIEDGDGLVGQCIKEKDKIYLTDVPEDYIRITSGLGDSSPKCILLIPIVKQEEALGAIELATFRPFQDFEVEFIEKLAESLASAISNVKFNEKSRLLLEETQVYSEQIKAQEEMMRQNMEELIATQEEMQRKEKQLLEIIKKSNLSHEAIPVKTQSLYSNSLA